jgi:AAA+ ATPase superfamily predicted ATPase
MHSKNIFGRDRELSLFEQIEENSMSEFVAVYGRRRIGKTYLVHEYFKNHKFFFEFIGTKNSPAKIQIKNFYREIKRKWNSKVSEEPRDWSEALSLLVDLIEMQSVKKTDEKKIIFFDELPWLASKKSGFIEALEYLWNSFLSKRADVILVVCGSSANWMISQIVNNKGGLHNRLTRPPIAMMPFTLRETQRYLKTKAIDVNPQQIAEFYMVTGGVAYYLNQIQRGETSAQFINRTFFMIAGELRNEFERLFQSLFDHFEIHVKIVKCLAQHPFGLSQKDLIEYLGINSGGTFTKILTELEKSDFIRFTPQLGNKRKEGIYRLIDEYTLFYLTWIQPLARTFQDRIYWQKQVGKPRYNSWLGYAFENLCFKHSEELVSALGISGLTTQIYGYRTPKVQIDLVIERSDKALNLCEMKYTGEPYEMSASEVEKLKTRKTGALANIKRNVQVFITLVTLFPAKKNKYYLSIIDNEINLVNLLR